MPGQKSYFSQTQQTVINVAQGLGGNQSFSDFVVINQQNQLYTYCTSTSYKYYRSQ